MERNNNTYGALINNKFSELLSANSTKTWAGMKELLDKKMPEKKKRKWLLWFTTKTGIVAIALLSLFASATGAYIGLSQKSGKNDNVPVKEMKNDRKVEKNNLKNEEFINKNNSPEIVNIRPKKKAKISLPATVTIKDKGVMHTSEIHKGKTNNSPVTAKQMIPAEQKKDTVTKNFTIISVPAKDSTVASADSSQTEVVERRRAF